MYPAAPTRGAPAGNDDAYLAMSDEEIERAIARIRVAFRGAYPESPPPAGPTGGGADDYLSMSDEDIEHAIERIRVSFRRRAAS
jgi:hypothetical protein